MAIITRFLFGETAEDYVKMKDCAPKTSLSEVLPLNGTLSRCITRVSASLGLVQMASAVDAVFGNTNVADVDKVGYKTKASEGLPFRVILAGIQIDKDGNAYKVYTTDKPIVEYGTYYKAEAAIRQINEEGKFKKAGFGEAYFPTRDDSNTGTNELDLLYQNQEELGLNGLCIHGEAFDDARAIYLDCDNGYQYDEDKNEYDADCFPVWRIKAKYSIN